MAIAPPTLAEWLVTHPWDNPETTDPPSVPNAYHLNAGENVIADITITDHNGDPIPGASVEAVLLELRRGEAPVGSWDQDSAQVDIQDGHIFLEILKSDTELLAGLYDFYVQLSVVNAGFFDSGDQTDVREAKAVLFVQAAIVNPT